MGTRLLGYGSLLGLLLLAGSGTAADPPRVDPYGDPLPEGAKARLGTARMIRSNAFTPLPPEYKTAAAVVYEKGVRLFDVSTGRVVRSFGEKGPTTQQLAAVSGDGKRVATWEYGVVTIWEVGTGRRVREFPRGFGGPSTPSWMEHNLFALSADGKVMAVGSLVRKQAEKAAEAEVVIWDVDRGERLTRVAVSQAVPLAPILSPDGKTLATWAAVLGRPTAPIPGRAGRPADPPADVRQSIRLWDVATGKELATVRTSRDRPAAMGFSPDGRIIAASAGGELIERWEVRTGHPLPLLRSTAARTRRLAFSPDGKTLAAVAADGLVERWAVADGQSFGPPDPPPTVPTLRPQGIGFTSDERVIAWGTVGGFGIVWEAASRKVLSPLAGHGLPIAGIGFAPGTDDVLTYTIIGPVIRWDPRTGRAVERIPVWVGDERPDPPTVLGIRLRGNDMLYFNRPGSRPVYDIRTDKRLFTLGREQFPRSPDACRMAVVRGPDPKGSRAIPIEAWNPAVRRKVAEVSLTSPTGNLGASPTVAFSPDGSRMVTAVNSPPVRVPGQPIIRPGLMITGWDLKTGKKLGEVVDPDQIGTTSLAAANNTSAIVSSATGLMRAVDFEAGRLGFQFGEKRGNAGTLPPVFRPDGTRFAVSVMLKPGEYGVRVYDWPRGKLLRTFGSHTGLVSALAFSPDGKTLASGSNDGTVLLWDLSNIPK